MKNPDNIRYIGEQRAGFLSIISSNWGDGCIIIRFKDGSYSYYDTEHYDGPYIHIGKGLSFKKFMISIGMEDSIDCFNATAGITADDVEKVWFANN